MNGAFCACWLAMLEVISREESKLYLKTSISDHFVIYTDRRKLIFSVSVWFIYIPKQLFTLVLVKVMEIYLYIWWITVNDWVDHRFVSYLKSILCKAFETGIFNWMSKEIKYWTRLVCLVSIFWCNSFYYRGLKQSTEECPVRMEDYWSTFGNCRVTNLTV